MQVIQRIEFEVHKEEEVFLFSYEFHLNTSFDKNGIDVECVEEMDIPASWKTELENPNDDFDILG